MDINAKLKHPEIQGPPLERGTRYGHHFVVELISDGRRLWAVASEEGRKVLNEIAHGLTGDKPEVRRSPTIAEYVEAGYSAKDYPPVGYASCSTEEEIAAAIEAQDKADAATLAAAIGGDKIVTGAEPVPNQSGTGGEAPTTVTSSATNFDG